MPPRDPARVAVDGRSLTHPRTGIGVFTAALVTEWVAAGHDVTVLTTDAREVADLTGVDVVQLKSPFHLNVALIARRDRVRYYSPDSLIVPAMLGRAATATVHDLAPLLHGKHHLPRARLAYRVLLATALRRAGGVLVPSEATRRDVLDRHPHAEVTVVGEGVRPLPAPAPLPAGVRPPYLLSVGSLEPRKHPVELAEAFLAAAPEPWQLVVAGPLRWLDRRDCARLDELAADPRIHRLGYVDDATVAGLLAHAGAFAYVSSYEGFGLPVLEAMAAGVPVLTTTAPALAELAGDAAMLLDLDAPEPYGAGLRAALSTLLTDADLRADLARRGKTRASAYSWEKAAALAWAALSR